MDNTNLCHSDAHGFGEGGNPKDDSVPQTAAKEVVSGGGTIVHFRLLGDCIIGHSIAENATDMLFSGYGRLFAAHC